MIDLLCTVYVVIIISYTQQPLQLCDIELFTIAFRPTEKSHGGHFMQKFSSLGVVNSNSMVSCLKFR